LDSEFLIKIKLPTAMEHLRVNLDIIYSMKSILRLVIVDAQFFVTIKINGLCVRYIGVPITMRVIEVLYYLKKSLIGLRILPRSIYLLNLIRSKILISHLVQMIFNRIVRV
jgi:hypothetical protein